MLLFQLGPSGAAAHKVTRLNHFSGLAALLRNFFAPYRLIVLLEVSDPPSRCPSLPLRPGRKVAHEKHELALSTFLKNNTKFQPAWQGIVDFCYRP
jgi:hypothetical protein